MTGTRAAWICPDSPVVPFMEFLMALQKAVFPVYLYIKKGFTAYEMEPNQ